MKSMYKKLIKTIVFIPLFSSCVVFAELAAPNFSLQTSDGEVSLKDYKGKILYLDFWASWCGPCRASFPWMDDMQKKYKKQGVEFLAINVDAKKVDADKFLEKMNISFKIAYDPEGKTPELYRIPGMPSSYIINRDGMIVSRQAGFRKNSIEK